LRGLEEQNTYPYSPSLPRPTGWWRLGKETSTLSRKWDPRGIEVFVKIEVFEDLLPEGVSHEFSSESFFDLHVFRAVFDVFRGVRGFRGHDLYTTGPPQNGHFGGVGPPKMAILGGPLPALAVLRVSGGSKWLFRGFRGVKKAQNGGQKGPYIDNPRALGPWERFLCINSYQRVSGY